MAPKGSAVAALKETLVRQYGASTRDVVEAEVEGRLAGRKRLEREDLDAIEQAVLGALKQRRGGAAAPGSTTAVRRPLRQQRSSPALLGKSSSLTAVGEGVTGTHGASLSSTAPAQKPAERPRIETDPALKSRLIALRNAPKTPPLPNGYGASRSTQPIGGTGVSLVNPKVRSTHVDTGEMPYRPFATSLVDADDCSERSRVICRPKRPIPLKPKVKPMDHWDLIVAYDSEKYRIEEEGFVTQGKHDQVARFRRVLDGQMEEIRALREQEAENMRREQEDMEEQIRENKRIAEDEHAMEEHRKNVMKKANDDMMKAIEKQKAREKAKRDKEQREVLNWMEMEKQRKEREERENAEMYARKCKAAKDELERARLEAEEKKRQRQEDERRECAEAQAAMDGAEASNRQAVADRLARIEELGRTFGAAIEKRDAEEAARLEASIKRVEEEAERAAKEDAARRKNEHNKRVKNMIDTLDKQMKEREEQGKIDKIENLKQAQIWREEVAEGLRKEQEDIDSKRQAREALDKMLIEQIREESLVHPLQYATTPGVQRTELAYNRALFEQMAREGFYQGHLGEFLAKTSDKGTGKGDPFPSVGPTKLAIDPMEIPEPDVS